MKLKRKDFDNIKYHLDKYLELYPDDAGMLIIGKQINNIK